jgi:uncharacterized DUF497 family protein
MDYNPMVKNFSWDEKKNQLLIDERNISFAEVIYAIAKGQLLDIVSNPNQGKYMGQKIFVLNINDYAYLVPFHETDQEIYLVTIIPSRKATRKYLRGKNDE